MTAGFRRAGPGDAGLVRALTRAAYVKWVPALGREPLPMQADYEKAVREHRIDLLSIEGEVRALIETMRRPDHLWIENIAVSPAAQRQGLGRQLLTRAEGLAVEAGLTELRLLTNALFAGNVALYQRAGYHIDREEPFEKGGVTVWMSKRLTRLHETRAFTRPVPTKVREKASLCGPPSRHRPSTR